MLRILIIVFLVSSVIGLPACCGIPFYRTIEFDQTDTGRALPETIVTEGGATPVGGSRSYTKNIYRNRNKPENRYNSQLTCLAWPETVLSRQ